MSPMTLVRSALSRLRNGRPFSHLLARYAPLAASHFGAEAPYPFVRRDDIRLRHSASYLLAGTTGIEIGAGPYPSLLPPGVRCEYYDTRDAAGLAQYFAGAATPPTRHVDEISARFPDGVDFLIAHNVLEHTPDPIGTLLAWLRWLRRDGVAILSLPHRLVCAGDALRPATTIEHVLLDYALGEQSTSLGSREHFIAGCVGWAAHWPEMSKNEFAEGILRASTGAEIEHHVHVFDDVLTEKTVQAALWLRGAGRILALTSPYTDPATDGDIIVVIGESGAPVAPPELDDVRALLQSALDRLGRGGEQS